MAVLELTEKNAMNFNNGVMYIYQDNCPPCAKLAPIFLALSDDLPEVTFAKFKLANESAFKRKYLKVGINEKPYGTPTLIRFRNGEPTIQRMTKELNEPEILEYFIINGELPPKPANPLLEGLSDEIKEALLLKDNLFEEMRKLQKSIEDCTKAIDSGDVEAQMARALLMQEAPFIQEEYNQATNNLTKLLGERNADTK